MEMIYVYYDESVKLFKVIKAYFVVEILQVNYHSK